MVPKVKVSPDLMSGDVDEGYGKVADVFPPQPEQWPGGRRRFCRLPRWPQGL